MRAEVILKKKKKTLVVKGKCEGLRRSKRANKGELKEEVQTESMMNQMMENPQVITARELLKASKDLERKSCRKIRKDKLQINGERCMSRWHENTRLFDAPIFCNFWDMPCLRKKS